MWARLGPRSSAAAISPLLDLLFLLHQGDGIAMDGMRDLVTERSRELLLILHEIQERIHHVYIAAGSCKGVGCAS